MGIKNQQSPADQPAGSATALRRKVATGQAEHQARAMSLPKALRLSVAKVADDLFNLAMASFSFRTQEIAGPDVGGVLAQGGLLVLLDGPQRRRAAAVLDADFVGALIQQQTMGQVLPSGDATPRVLTATDAAICAPFLNALMKGVEALVEGLPEKEMVDGFRFGARADDARQLMLALDAARYHVVQIGVDIALGARQGNVTLCLPIREIEETNAVAKGRETDPDGTYDGRSTKPQLSDTLMALEADLRISLSVLKLPLHRLSALKPGDVLELTGSSFDRVEILTRDGKRLGRGALGQIDGVRAVQVAKTSHGKLTPARRDADREGLELPAVEAKGLAGSTPSGDSAKPRGTAQSDRSLDMDAVSFDLPDLPDMSDLPGFDAEDLPTLPALAAAG